MPKIERTADIAGTGISPAAQARSAPRPARSPDSGIRSRRESARPEGKTSPEELLAAAHGGCLTMSLVGELTGADTPPGHLDATCRIVMDEVEGRGHQIVASHVDLTVAADGLDDGALQAHLAKADEGCPFSALLRNAGAEVHVSAHLAG